VNRALFVSDIHISSPKDPKHGLFLRFLKKCLEAPPAHLFLVGDIFDLWIADKPFFVKRYEKIIEAVRELRAKGVVVHYFEGNHDLDLSVFWRQNLGVDVHTSAEYFQLDGRVLRVEHGDEMDPDDRGYLFLRWLLRTPVMRVLGRVLPDPLVRWIGERASVASRDYTSNVKTTSDERSVGKIRKHAKRVFADQPFDMIVSGHLHVLDDSWQEAEGRRFRCVNLGTWLKTPFVLSVEGERVHLMRVEDFVR
jgi:UDP-2,3-diacylglucosamine hydrolase